MLSILWIIQFIFNNFMFGYYDFVYVIDEEIEVESFKVRIWQNGNLKLDGVFNYCIKCYYLNIRVLVF